MFPSEEYVQALVYVDEIILVVESKEEHENPVT